MELAPAVLYSFTSYLSNIPQRRAVEDDPDRVYLRWSQLHIYLYTLLYVIREDVQTFNIYMTDICANS